MKARRLVVVHLLAVLVLLAGCDIEQRYRLDHVDWLPDSAKDIGYFRTSGFVTYECLIPEEALLKLAESKDWHLNRTGAVDLSKGNSAILKAYIEERYGTNRVNAIRNALVYDGKQQNGGEAAVVYDRDAKRLFAYEERK